MGVKRRIVVATSLPYPDGTVRPPEELEAAVKRRRHVPLTLGHPPRYADGRPMPIPEDILLGDVEYSYDKERKIQVGNTTFFDEYIGRLPEHIRSKVINLDPFDISQGFEHEWKEENTLSNIMPHHLAVLVDEKPLCPLTMCGVNARMESGTNYRYEQRAETTEEGITMTEQEDKSDVDKLRDEFAERFDKLETLFIEKQTPPKEPVVVEHEALNEAEPPPQPEPEHVRPPVRAPVRDVPASAPVGDGLERDSVTGGIVFYHQGDRKKTK